MTRITLQIIVIMLVSAASVAFQGGPPGSPFGNRFAGGGADRGFGDSRDRVEVAIEADRTRVARGEKLAVVVTLDLDPGWHCWPNERDLPDSYAVFDGAIATKLAIDANVAGTVVVDPGTFRWPEVHGAVADVGLGPERYAVFEGRAPIAVPVVIAGDAPLGPLTLTATMTFQSCDASSCLMPVYDATYELELEIVEAGGDEPRTDGAFADFPHDAFPEAPAADSSPIFGEEFYDSRDRVHVTAKADRVRVGQGENAVVAIVFEHAPGWHIWTNARELPASYATFDGAIHSEILIEEAGGTLRAGDIQWPEIHASTADVGDGPKSYATFAGRVIAYVPITVSADAPPGPAVFGATVSFQACDEFACMPPAEVRAEVKFEIVGAGAGDAESTHADFAGYGEMATPSGATEPGPAGSDVNESDLARGNFLGFIPIPSGLFFIAVLSLIGGAVLNLTPCVLPIIPIKILTISQHAGTPGKSLYLGIWMALGVVAFWFGIGLPVALFRSVTDPSMIFGIWWVTLAIGLLIGVMGVGIMGLFVLNLPQKVYLVNPKADNAWGSFLFGIMTAVLGLPCFGFVAGALLAGTATMPTINILVIFLSIGIGMAAPYLVLAVKPGLVDKIPRTGPASELVKQVMGLMLLAAAAFFIGTGFISLIAEHPYLSRQLHIWIVAIFLLATGGWLIMRTFQISPAFGKRAFFGLVGLAIAVFPMWFALDETSKARESWTLMAEAASGSPGTYTTKTWNRFTPELFEQARADGHVVVLDFTAEWCITCKALKAKFLDRDPLKSLFAEDDIVPFLADLTSRYDPGWTMLQDGLGQTGIPQLAVFTPGNETPWIQQVYTSETVITAIEAARAASKQVARN